MNVKYISQEKLDVIRDFLERRDISSLPMELPMLMFYAEKLYTTSSNELLYHTSNTIVLEKDLAVDFDEKGEILSFVLFDDYSGEVWTIDP